MSQNKKIIVSLVVIALIILGAYSTEYFFKENGLNSGSIVKVNNNAKLAAYMDKDVLTQLAGQKGKSSKNHVGPTLSSVLTAAGISYIEKVQVKGLHTKSPQKFDQKEINDDLVFYFTNHNTVNLGRKKDYPHYLVKDVTEINAISK